MKRVSSLLAGCALMLSSGCTSKSKSESNDGTVVTTVGMIADVAREICGDERTVVNLIGEGTDPHNYAATKGDIDKIQNAALVLYNGHLLEGKMGSILGNRREDGKPVVAVAEDLEEVELIGEGSHPDPHLWMDVSIWSKVAGRIAESLTELDSDKADQYQENLAEYQKTLLELDAYAKSVMATIPENQRVLVTAHDAFSYLGRAYGIEVRGIQGISTESEAAVKEIRELVEFLVERKIPAVFIESSVPTKSVEALIEGAAAEGHKVIVGGELFSDAMGPAGTYEGTYVGMIDHNLTTIARALGGEAPEKGFQGKLSGE